MKKLLALLFVAILPFAVFTACSDDDKKAPTQAELVEAVKGDYNVTVLQGDVTTNAVAKLEKAAGDKVNLVFTSTEPVLGFTLPALDLTGKSTKDVTINQVVKDVVINTGEAQPATDVTVTGKIKDGKVAGIVISYKDADGKTVKLTLNSEKDLAAEVVGVYNSNLSVLIGDVPIRATEQEPIKTTGTITLTKIEGQVTKVNFNLTNFKIEIGDNEIEVPVEIKAVPLAEKEGKVVIENYETQVTVLQSEDNPDGTPAEIVLNGNIVDKKMSLTLAIVAGGTMNIDVTIDGTKK